MESIEALFKVKRPEDSSGFLLWQVTTLWQKQIKLALQKHHLSHPQFVILASTLWLSQFEASITQIALSNHTKIDPMTTSTVLRSLQERGLLSRLEHETDTRAKAVMMTENGRDLAKLALKTVGEVDKKFFHSLQNKPQFNEELLSILKRNMA